MKRAYFLCLLALGFIPGSHSKADPGLDPRKLAADERLLVILGTNDMHGGFEPQIDPKLGPIGGIRALDAVVRATRAGLAAQYGARAGTLLFDAGDQFQGTLISNCSEGEGAWRLFRALRYDALVLGNHGYDFGPLDWRRDKLSDTIDSFEDLGALDQCSHPDSTKYEGPRGALEKILEQNEVARLPAGGGNAFAVLSANTYRKADIQDSNGKRVEVQGIGCRPTRNGVIDWTKSKPIYPAYTLKTVAEMRIAIIALDHPDTPSTTTEDNVSDLCFREEYESYIDSLEELKKLPAEEQPDLRVLVIHDGNVPGKDNHLSTLVEKIAKLPGRPLDAVISGHTHQSDTQIVAGIPIVQSRADGLAYGRVELVWNSKIRQIIPEKTFAKGAIRLFPTLCELKTESFCTIKDGKVYIEGQHARFDDQSSEVALLMNDILDRAGSLGKIPLGYATKELRKERDIENTLSNQVTDEFRAMTGADVAIVNGGGLRTNVPEGPINYALLFRIFPFNNHAWVIGPASVSQLVALFDRAARSCGAHGSLFPSGITIEYSRDCPHRAKDQIDPLGQVEKMIFRGEVLVDRSVQQEPLVEKELMVATIDFLGTGKGSGYIEFGQIPKKGNFDRGVLRELLRQKFQTTAAVWTPVIDGRWKNIVPGGDSLSLEASPVN